MGYGGRVPGSPPLRSNTAQVVVQTESGQQFLVPTELLVQQPDGSYSLPLRLAELEHSGSEHRGHQDEPMVVPVLVEELEVQKRPVETGKVRMTKVVHERETTVDEPLWHDNVAITRVPIQRVVEGPVPVRRSMAQRLFPSWKRCWSLKSVGCCGRRSTSVSNASRRTSHNVSRYAAKTYRLSVYLTLMNIHEGEVVWQRHW